jgi:hypothetical protein
MTRFIFLSSYLFSYYFFGNSMFSDVIIFLFINFLLLVGVCFCVFTDFKDFKEKLNSLKKKDLCQDVVKKSVLENIIEKDIHLLKQNSMLQMLPNAPEESKVNHKILKKSNVRQSQRTTKSFSGTSEGNKKIFIFSVPIYRIFVFTEFANGVFMQFAELKVLLIEVLSNVNFKIITRKTPTSYNNRRRF